jgi:cytochrome bd ubiquinol oxidase subunit II
MICTLHGALFLSLRTTDQLKERAEKIASFLWIPIALITAVFAIMGYWQTVLFEGLGLVPGSFPTLAILSFISCFVFIKLKMQGYAFAAMAGTILLGTAVIFYGLFPNVMPSSIDASYSLTVYNASSSQLTLKIMSIVALFFVPIVLAYQGWSYYVFSKRVSRDAIPRDK